MQRIPKRFVGLHAHSSYSIYDCVGLPSDHIDYVLENGMDAWALTDHGNCNGFAGANLKEAELRKQGVKFKLIPGVEAYIHPDLDEWAKAKFAAEEAAKTQKKAKKSPIILGARAADIGTDNVENEDASKTNKWLNPVNRRHHLVVLAKTQRGLNNMFTLVSRSHAEGFYKFPRIDYKMLKQHGQDLVVSTACCAGLLAHDVVSSFPEVPWDELGPRMDRFDEVQAKLKNSLDRLVDAVGEENVFVELQFNSLKPQHLINQHLIALANSTGMKLIATADSHYCRPDYWQSREIYKKLGWLNYEKYDPKIIPQSVDELKCELYPKNALQMWEAYKKYCAGHDFYNDDEVCDAIERTYDIAHDLIVDPQPDRSPKLPSYVVPKGKEEHEALVELAWEGLERLELHDKEEYRKRLEYELDIIKGKKFSKYFLTMKAIIDIAWEHMLVGPARGSSAGSLLCYALGITQIDPIKYGLMFERFLNPARDEYPDVDTDFADRDLLIKLLKEKFGDQNVIYVSNFNTFKLNSLVRDLSRFYGISFEEVNAVMKRADSEVRKRVLTKGVDKNTYEMTYEQALEHSPVFNDFINAHPKLGEHINVLLKQPKSIGKHAGGILLCDDLLKQMPVIKVRGELQSPWAEGLTSKDLHHFGFIKVDALAIEMLRIMQRCIENILITYNNEYDIVTSTSTTRVMGSDVIDTYDGKLRAADITVGTMLSTGETVMSLPRVTDRRPAFADVREWYMKNMHPSVLDMNESEVYDNVYSQQRWAGIFQVTSPGAQRFFAKGKPKSVIDIAALTSVYRPGPLAADVDKLYIGAKNDPDSVKYEHPILKEILSETFGCLVFQEQTLKIANRLGGMNPADCDRLRKTLMKKEMSGESKRKKELTSLREMFITGAVERGMTKSGANEIFKKMQFFSGYGFNFSHALSYAIDSYYCAWLLTHYPSQWLCAYIESQIGDPGKRANAMRELKSFGYDITNIDINSSTDMWTVNANKQFMPSFRTIKGIGSAAIDEIMAARPYRSVHELLWNDAGKWRHSKFNKRALDAFIKIGAFESLDVVGPGKMFENYAHMHRVVVGNMDTLKKKGPESLEQIVEATREESKIGWSTRQVIKNKSELMGYFDVGLIVTPKIRKKFDELKISAIDEMSGQRDICWFIINDVKHKLTKNNKPYLFLTVLGEQGRQTKLFVWNASHEITIKKYSLCVAEIDVSDFGHSTTMKKMKLIGAKKNGKDGESQANADAA